MSLAADRVSVPKLGRKPSLDGIRAFAVIAVLLAHAFNGLFPGGALGVDIFFVLSGFFISTLLIEEWDANGRVSLRAFWSRRALRLVPALVLFIPFAAAVALYAGDSVISAAFSSFAALFYFTNFSQLLGLPVGPTFGHTWSLAIEEQFYLLWPLFFIFLMMRRSPRIALVAALGFVVIVIPIWRVVLISMGSEYGRIKVAPDTRFDELAIGCLLAALVSFGILPLAARTVARWLSPIAVAFLFLWLFWGGPNQVTNLASWGYSATGVATAVLILAVISDRGLLWRILGWKALVWFGRRSYGIYLWHFVALVFFGTLLAGQSELVIAAFALPVSVTIAALSYQYVEKPFLALKGRFRPVNQSTSPRVTADDVATG